MIVKCSECNGTGRDNRTMNVSAEAVPCWLCEGKGLWERPDPKTIPTAPFFVLVCVPEKHPCEDEIAHSIIGPFTTWDAAQQWRDTRITADGATSEILTPETPR